MEPANTEILREIDSLTRLIEEQYPELQKYLDETRNTLPQGSVESKIIDNDALHDYRDSLKELIHWYQKEEAIKKEKP